MIWGGQLCVNLIRFIKWRMREKTLTERITIMLSPDELEPIDDFRFASRLSSRGEAIRRLVRAGLTVEAKSLKKVASKRK